MSGRVLYGKPVADAIRGQASRMIDSLAAVGKTPRLATIRVGERPEDVAYERSIIKLAGMLGIEVDVHAFDEDVNVSMLTDAITWLNADEACDGIMLFRPLPAQLNEGALCEAIATSKDVDGVCARSLAGVFTGANEGFAPATAEACVALLDYYEVPLSGVRACVVGRSLVIGKPVGMMLLERDATVTYCHSRTRDLVSIMSDADVVVCCVGRAGFFGADYFGEDQVVLDVGVNDDGNGGICGDVNYEAVLPMVGALTPVPRGIGTISTSILLKHVAEAAMRSAKLSLPLECK